MKREEQKEEEKIKEQKESSPSRERERFDENSLQSNEKMMKEENEEN